MIRIIVDGKLNLPLVIVLQAAAKGYGFASVDPALLPFIHDRLRGYLRDQQICHDVVAAALANIDGDNIRLMAARATELETFLAGPDGSGFMAGWRRVSSILAAEEKKARRVFAASCDPTLFNDIEQALFTPLSAVADDHSDVEVQLSALGALCFPIDVF